MDLRGNSTVTSCVLVVDDLADNRFLLERMLKSLGVEVYTACDGDEAIEMVSTLNPGLILMDVEMPGLNGYQTTRKLRQLGYEKPILALTAHSQSEEQENSFQAGCNGIIGKPVSRQILQENLLKFFMSSESLH